MSPLWSELSLARAAWASAEERGLVDRQPDRWAVETRVSRPRDKPRRPIRQPVSSYAL